MTMRGSCSSLPVGRGHWPRDRTAAGEQGSATAPDRPRRGGLGGARARLARDKCCCGGHLGAVDPGCLRSRAGCLDRSHLRARALGGYFRLRGAGPDPRTIYDAVLAANLTNASRYCPRRNPETRHESNIAPGADEFPRISTRLEQLSRLQRRQRWNRRPGPRACPQARSGRARDGLAPGHIDTSMPRDLWADPERARRLLAEIPLQRRGHPREVATVIDFLCGDAATYITGQVINVDGGVVND